MADVLNLAFALDSIAITPDVVAGTTALGGSESMCFGLARALRARGHRVTIFAGRLAADVPTTDAAGVEWRPLEQLQATCEYQEFDALVVVRALQLLCAQRLHARLRIGWMHDLLTPGPFAGAALSAALQMDLVAYVSAFHRAQWEELVPALAPIGWVTRNGLDRRLLPEAPVQKDPHRVIYISRPERGLGPLLAMWPALRRRDPEATLAVCRYGTWTESGADVDAAWDATVARVAADVGGIEWLGELPKDALYRELARAAVLWYPGVSTFAETSCIAALEAMACGTPLVGSFTGALPETASVSYAHGLLVEGDAERDEAYQARSVDLVHRLMTAAAESAPWYRQLQAEGRAAAASATYDAIAAEWEARILEAFAARAAAHPMGIVHQLMQEDDHVAALQALEQVPDDAPGKDAAERRCLRLIAGLGETPDSYAEHATGDPVLESGRTPRMTRAIAQFRARGVRRLLDVACGHGALAIGAARAIPGLEVVGIDYSAANIRKAEAAARRAGVADRCQFITMPVYDYAADDLDDECRAWLTGSEGQFDGLFCGEFLEHVANVPALVDGLEAALAPGAPAIYTVPHGPWTELQDWSAPITRAHVHRFALDDVRAVFGEKAGYWGRYLRTGLTPRGNPVGHWLIGYAVDRSRPAGQRPLETRSQRTRPLPRLSVGIIAHNAEADLARCLQSVWPIADEIVVGDTGSTDATRDIATRYGARVLTLPPVAAFGDGFAGARNAVLEACTGEWFFWIDCDEQLHGAAALRAAIESPVYRAFVLRQQHLALDLPLSHDSHARVFRRDPGVQFFGCIHEQPGDGDANRDILPAIGLPDVQLAHLGQLHASLRIEKALVRNLPLLERDRERFPDRRIGPALVIRDCVNLAEVARAEHGGVLSPQSVEYFEEAVRLFEAHYGDPADRFADVARPYYEAALQALGRGFQVQMALRITAPGETPGGPPPLERLVVQSADEMHRLVSVRLTAARQAMMPPVLRVAPVLPPRRSAQEVA